ncbi:MAG: hypothetical protein K1000chlam3_01690 [Chlamydiae bacterium]|nr:hypothetical protein [Chlamydiota bacterium]
MNSIFPAYSDKYASIFYENIVPDFSCPDFYTCKIMNNLNDCKKTLQSAKDYCKEVSTQLVGVEIEIRGIKYFSTTRTDEVFEGPKKFLAVIHNPKNEKIYNFFKDSMASVEDYFKEVSTLKSSCLAIGTIAIAIGTIYLINKLNNKNTPIATPLKRKSRPRNIHKTNNNFVLDIVMRITRIFQNIFRFLEKVFLFPFYVLKKV